MSTKRRIELLVPAKDLDTARAAIQHGADAVYIGAPRFGARAAAGVSLEDLRLLCVEAHRYGVRVYVTLNTIIYDHELSEVERLIWDIYHCGADALIIQDLGLTLLDLPPIPLHSSTQCDTVEPEDAMQLEALGFEQIVLARELNLEQIRRIKAVTNKPLEVFVHGALCVSYSGRCYISQAFTKRSANRGECSQQCRLPYNLRDSKGTLIRRDEHLLSPKDLNRYDILEDLLEAGASSLKIEGRLKSISYVKNIAALYRTKLDEIIARYPDRYERASWGDISFRFTPQADKSFNRGFTDYQFTMPSPQTPKVKVVNIHTPKSQGEYIGELIHCDKSDCLIKTTKALANGDGLLYITPQGEVGGVNINRSVETGRVILARPLRLPKGTKIYRNHSQEWERMIMAPNSAIRRLPIKVKLSSNQEGLVLDISVLEGRHLDISATLPMTLEPAKRFDADRIRVELSKFGDTIFEVKDVEIDFSGAEYFIPLSLLSQLRKDATEQLVQEWDISSTQDTSNQTLKMKLLDRGQLPARPHFKPDYRANVANRLARLHYQSLGYAEVDDAFELTECNDAYLMTTKHCIKHELGYCTRETRSQFPFAEPLYLEQANNRIRLHFDCHRCQMLLTKA